MSIENDVPECVTIIETTYNSIEFSVENIVGASYCIIHDDTADLSKKLQFSKTDVVRFYSLSSSTRYVFVIDFYSQDDSLLLTRRLVVTTPDEPAPPYTNYIKYNGEYHELYTCVMQTDHNYTGTGTGENFKILRMNGDSYVWINFTYVVPEWEGITRYWDEGTYYIENSSGHYTYGCSFNAGTSTVKWADGVLKISRNGNVMKFVFDMECSGSPLTGQFIGVVN